LDTKILQDKRDEDEKLWEKLGTFDRKKLTILELLGQGSFGSVYRAQYEKKKVVVKQLSGNGSTRSKEELADDLKYEARMLLNAETVGVIKLIAIDPDNEPPRMVLEYLPNGNLEREYQLAKKKDPNSIFHPDNEFNLAEKENNPAVNPVLLQMVRIARDIAGALTRIHEKGIIHLDIAARNILLDLNKRPKIADFGCAVREETMKELQEMIKSSDSNSEAKHGDEESERERSLLMRQRPAKWMPPWALDEPPRIDRKYDIYSFGCVMFEMCAQETPHEREAEVDIMKLKKDQRINPDIPRDVDPAYTTIMSSCWESYDRQAPMPDIAKKLSALHTELATKSVPKDKLYEELLTMFSKGKSEKSVDSNASSARTDHRNGSSRFRKNDLSDEEESFYSGRGGSIVLTFDHKRDSYDSRKLTSALNCAYRFRDHQFIFQILKSIVLKEDDAVTEVMCLCLEYLEQLAEDQHGSTNEEETYQWLAKGIMETLKVVKDLGIQDPHADKIVGFGLSALASLLVNKSLPENSEKDMSFQDDLCSIIFDAIQDFGSNEFVAERVAIAIFSVSGLSQTVVKKLHYEKGVVGGLLEILKTHKTDYEVVIEIVRALSCFPIHFLVDPIFSMNSTKAKPPVKLVKVVSSSSHRGRKTAALEQSGPKSTQMRLNKETKISDNWGLVYSEVLYFVRNCVEQSERKSYKDRNDKLAEMLLETCLTSLFRICESGVNEIELINKILHKVEESDIACLVKAIKIFPDSFRMQEGGIGLLAHVISTGFPVYIRDRSGKCIQTIDATVSSEDRMSLLLAKDEKLNLIIRAMGKFKIKEEISTGIKEKDSDYMSEITISQTVFHKSATNATALATSKTRASTTILDFNNLSAQANQTDEPVEIAFNLDEMGEQITAAALQRSAALILGASCNSRKFGKTMQNNLERSKFNETVLASFRNFSNDVSLIRFGCHAIYFTCRRHIKHQATLKKLSIERHLYRALEKHKAIWEIVEAVICAVTGILEPPSDVSDMTNDMYDSMFKSISGAGDSGSANKRKIFELTQQAINQKKTLYVGHWFAKELNKNLGNTTVFQSLTLSVATNVIYEECYLLLRNFLLLVCCVGFWLPDVMNSWNNGKFVNLGQLFTNTKFKEQFNLAMIPNSKTEQLIFHFSNKKKLEHFRNDYEYNVVQFTILALSWHSGNPDVLAASLAIITNTIGNAISKNNGSDYKISEEQIAEYSDPKSLISKHRQTAIDTDLFKLSMEACTRQEDHPILIRYSLWLLLIFISQQDENPNESTQAKLIAGEISVGGCLEWAMEVCRRYQEFYSLQVLSGLFMLWMEYHGFFDNEDLDELKEIKVIMEKNVKEPSTSFRSLEEEGFDTNLLGVTNDTFGNLQSIAQKLIDRIDLHLLGLSNVKMDNSLYDKPFKQFNWETRTERTKEGLDIKKPEKLLVVGFHQETKDGAKVYVFDIEVYWSGGKRWSIQRSFEDCLTLKDDLEFELGHLGLSIGSSMNIKRTVGMAFSKVISFVLFYFILFESC
jgi:serine/threonine protein kinase